MIDDIVKIPEVRAVISSQLVEIIRRASTRKNRNAIMEQMLDCAHLDLDLVVEIYQRLLERDERQYSQRVVSNTIRRFKEAAFPKKAYANFIDVVQPVLITIREPHILNILASQPVLSGWVLLQNPHVSPEIKNRIVKNVLKECGDFDLLYLDRLLGRAVPEYVSYKEYSKILLDRFPGPSLQAAFHENIPISHVLAPASIQVFWEVLPKPLIIHCVTTSDGFVETPAHVLLSIIEDVDGETIGELYDTEDIFDFKYVDKDVLYAFSKRILELEEADEDVHLGYVIKRIREKFPREKALIKSLEAGLALKG